MQKLYCLFCEINFTFLQNNFSLQDSSFLISLIIMSGLVEFLSPGIVCLVVKGLSCYITVWNSFYSTMVVKELDKKN